MELTNGGRARHARADDRLLPFDEVAQRLLMPEPTVRWKRHQGDLPFLFKLGRRLVAWESDVLSWIEDQARADVESREVRPVERPGDSTEQTRPPRRRVQSAT